MSGLGHPVILNDLMLPKPSGQGEGFWKARWKLRLPSAYLILKRHTKGRELSVKNTESVR